MTRRLFFKKILSTPDFFKVLAKYLDKIFDGEWIYDVEEVDDIICSIDSTAGWQRAMFNTCVELDIYDVYEYWVKLSWEESDILDGEISELLCAIAYDENGHRELGYELYEDNK